MRSFVLALITFASSFVVGCSTPGAASPDASAVGQDVEEARRRLVEGRRLLAEAVEAGDIEALLATRERFASLTATPEVDELAFYFVAYTDYRLVGLHYDDADQGVEFADHGIAHAKAAVEREDSAEARALLGAILGQKAWLSRMEAIVLGPASDREVDAALELDPKNPRAVLLHAVSLANKPSLFGGDPDEALVRLDQAQQLFDEQPVVDPLRPDWGRADVHAWRGVIYMRKDRFDEARASYEAALAVQPTLAWVRQTLLPALAEAEGSSD